jgi:UDP-N-acetylglucosamine transferase subunit ALG13
MHHQPFDRLVITADEMASLINEPVVIQLGVSQYRPVFSRYFDFTSGTQIQELLSEARVVVSHSGAGSILSALRAGKPSVIVPRLKCLGEHFDDHQLELAEALVRQGKVVTVMDLSAETLWRAIVRATQLTGKTSANCSLRDALQEWLKEQAAQPKPKRWWLLQRWWQEG